MPTPIPLYCNTRFSRTEAIDLIQTMIAEYNSLTRFQNSKKFAAFVDSDFKEGVVQNTAIFDRRFDLTDSIIYFVKTIGAHVEVKRLRVKLILS